MPIVRSTHLFYFLMAVSGVTAFVVPHRFSAHAPAIDALFVPVSWPAGAITRSIHNSFAAPEVSPDRRDAADVKLENERLKEQLSNMTARYEALRSVEGARSQVGPIRKYCTAVSVAATDSGPRESLGLVGTNWEGIRNGMFAIYPSGVVGIIERSSVVGARVKLVTDADFRVYVVFAHFDGKKFVERKMQYTVAEGSGKGAVYINGMTREAAKDVAVGDLAVVKDPEWPHYLQGSVIGRVVSKGRLPTHPLFDQIVVEPLHNLLRLNEVLVVTKEPPQ